MRFTAILGICGALAGCAEATAADTGSTDSDVVGITDLSALEASLGLVPGDRAADALRAGQCYQRTIGSIYGGLFEFRAYANGAAFFPKRGAAPGTGDQRAVACVDIDVSRDTPGYSSFALSGVSLDVAIRYRLGHARASFFGTGHSYALFEKSSVETGFQSSICGGGGPAQFPGFMNDLNPAFVAAHDLATCGTAFRADVAADSIDRPAFDADRYLYEVWLDHGGAVSGSLASLVHRYAQKSAADVDAFTLANDPVGSLVHAEEGHIRFEHLDAHDVTAYGHQLIAITPKLSDGDILGRAVASCIRSVDEEGRATSAFSCKGL